MVMNARCWCNEHLPQPPRVVLGLQDFVTEWNLVSHFEILCLRRNLLTGTSQTALRKYAVTYRASPSSVESFGLLRKAQRIEAYLAKAKEEKSLTLTRADTKLHSTKEETSSVTVKRDSRPISMKDQRPDPNHASSQTISV